MVRMCVQDVANVVRFGCKTYEQCCTNCTPSSLQSDIMHLSSFPSPSSVHAYKFAHTHISHAYATYRSCAWRLWPQQLQQASLSAKKPAGNRVGRVGKIKGWIRPTHTALGGQVCIQSSAHHMTCVCVCVCVCVCACAYVCACVRVCVCSSAPGGINSAYRKTSTCRAFSTHLLARNDQFGALLPLPYARIQTYCPVCSVTQCCG